MNSSLWVAVDSDFYKADYLQINMSPIDCTAVLWILKVLSENRSTTPIERMLSVAILIDRP